MKFKIGDKVRILDGRSDNTVLTLWTPGMTKAIGTIGTVLKIDEWDNTVLVAIGEDMDAYWMQGNWLVPVKEEKKSPSKSDLFASLLVTLDDVAKNPKPYPKHIYKGDGKTVVMWEDGTKTIVKRAEGEPDNDYAAFTAALAIKVYGDNSKVNRIVRMTETVEKRKKKKKQKEATEGKLESVTFVLNRVSPEEYPG